MIMKMNLKNIIFKSFEVFDMLIVTSKLENSLVITYQLLLLFILLILNKSLALSKMCLAAYEIMKSKDNHNHPQPIIKVISTVGHRKWILEGSPSVSEILEKFPPLIKYRYVSDKVIYE